MHKTILIVIAALVVLGALLLLLFSFTRPNQSQPDAGNTTSTAPFGEVSDTGGNGLTTSPPAKPGNPTQGLVAIADADGQKIMVKDFSQDPAVVPDPSNPGQFYLGYHNFAASSSPAQPDAPYYIDYIAATNFFNIQLNQEPLVETRQQAEQYLMQELGLSQSQMCKLRYSISAPNFVNQYYAGVELRFSFCEGAVDLPQ